MRVVVLGGTRFIGRRVVERLRERGDDVLVVHRGESRRGAPAERASTLSDGDDGTEHLHTDRRDLGDHAGRLRAFAPEAVVDTYALTGADVDAVPRVLDGVPAVVLSSQDVYQAYAAFGAGRCDAAVPVDEDGELRRERHPYRGLGLPGIPDDYEKLDVEQRWLDRGAVVLRLPVVYGPHDGQRREEPVLRRVRAGRTRIPVGDATLLWTRAHVDDVATGVLAALGTRAADGLAVNLGETDTVPVRTWFEQILAAAGSTAELVRVPDDRLPPDLATTAAPAQHLLFSVARARDLLRWRPADPATRVAESVRWHLAHPPDGPTWTGDDAAADDRALTGP